MSDNKEKYKKYITSKKWKEKKAQLFELRGKECEQCGYKHRLHVHHLTYERLGEENLDDLQILCFQCHMSKHDEYFDSLILKNRYKPKGYVPLKEGEVRLTIEMINNLKTKKGGVTRHVYKLFGFKKLPKKGWLHGQIGNPVNLIKYNQTVEQVREWEQNTYLKPKKNSTKDKKERHLLCNDLRKCGIKTINGKSISFIPMETLKKLHVAYC